VVDGLTPVTAPQRSYTRASRDAAVIVPARRIGTMRVSVGRRTLSDIRDAMISASTWLAAGGVCAAALTLVALIVLMVQNARRVEVTFLWMHGTLPLALALLIAGVGSAILTMVFGAPASPSCIG
jgi:uncharacterized integral membrane protein